MTSEATSQQSAYRQCLTMAAASICLESGYDSAQEVVLETLTEIMQSCELINIWILILFRLLV